MKLRTKFSLLTCTLTVLVVLGVSIFFYIAEKNMLFKEIQENKISLTNGLAEVSKESFITSNQIMLINYIKQIKNLNPEVAFAASYTSRGEIIAHSNSELIGEQSSKLFENNENISVTTTTVRTNNKPRGTAIIGFSDKFLQDKIDDGLAETRKKIAAVGGAGLLIGFIGAVILSVIMTKPIKKMTQAAEKIGDGNLDTKIDVTRKDELGGLAEDINRMAKKLKELDEMKQDFISSVTHEFRSPLNAMAIHFDLLFKGRLGEMTEEQKKSLTVLRNNAKRLEKFINDLLDISKIERGKMEISSENFDLIPVIDEIFSLYKVQGEKKDVIMEKKLPESLPQVNGDPDRTKQILSNLINNAIKFTPADGRVTVSAEKDSEDFVKVNVEDTGMGIPEEDRKGIFSKFEQVKGVRKKIKGQKGTGLGLAIAKQIIEEQDGKIWVESEVDKGSVFHFTLPIVKNKK
ncbi:MAG: ATP-binding protein [Elusimicrobiota bacterium]